MYRSKLGSFEAPVPFLLGLILLVPWILSFYPYASFDGANYHFQGWLLVNGLAPFTHFIDNKFPAVAYLLAPGAWLTEWSPFGSILTFRLLECVLLFVWLKIAALQLNQPETEHEQPKKPLLSVPATRLGVATLLTAYLGVSSSSFENIYTELPATVAVAFAIFIALRQIGRRSSVGCARSYLMGVCFGLAVLFRLTALLPASFLTVSLGLMTFRYFGHRKALHFLARICTGSFAVWAGAAILASSQGWLVESIQFAFVWNSKISATSVGYFVRVLDTLTRLYSTYFLFPLGLGILAFAMQRVLTIGHATAFCRANISKAGWGRESATLILVVWACGALAEASVPGIPSLHHFISVAPPLALVVGMALDNGQGLARNVGVAAFQRGVFICLILVMVCAATLNIQHAVGKFSTQVERRQSIEVGDWIKAHTKPHERILVWGYAPQIYLTSERFASSPFYHSYTVTGQDEHFITDASIRAEFERSMILNPPAVVVLASGLSVQRYSQFIAENYEAVSGEGIPTDLRLWKRRLQREK